MKRKDIILGIAVPIVVALIGVAAVFIPESSSKPGQLVVEDSFIYTEPDPDAPGNWVETSVSSDQLKLLEKDAARVAAELKERGNEINAAGKSGGKRYYDVRALHRYVKAGAREIRWEFNQSWLYRHGEYELYGEEVPDALKQEILASGFIGMDEIKNLLETYGNPWWRIAVEYSYAKIPGPPTKRFVVRNTGESSVTVRRINVRRIFSVEKGGGVHRYARALFPIKLQKALPVKTFEDTQLRLDNPVVIEPGETELLEVDVGIDKPNPYQTKEYLRAGFSLAIEYFDGEEYAEVLEGYYGM